MLALDSSSLPFMSSTDFPRADGGPVPVLVTDVILAKRLMSL